MTRNESDEITTNTGSGENDEQEEFSTRYDSAVTTAIILTRHPNPFLHRISSLISDLDDAAMTFGDLLAVGLTPLNEQIIENVLAGFVYPLLLEPLVMCLGGRGKRGSGELGRSGFLDDERIRELRGGEQGGGDNDEGGGVCGAEGGG